MVKKIFCMVVALFLLTGYLYPQAPHSTMYCRGGLFPGAVLDMTNISLPNGNGTDYVWVSNVQSASNSGNYNLSYNVSKTATTAGQYWGTNNSTVQVNTSINFLVSTADAHWVIASGKKYIFTMKDVPNGTNTVGYVFEFGGTPASISTVTNSPASENSPVTISAVMSAAPVTNQKVYLRWATTENFTNSTVTQMTGTGTTLTASIPGQAGGTSVYYYCFYSGAANIDAANCNPATVAATSIKNYSVQISTPALVVEPSSLTGFTYPLNMGPSSVQRYSLSGVLLSGAPGNITVTAPAHYEISKDSVNFFSSVLVPYTTSSLSTTHVFVRLKAGLPVGDYNTENITNEGGGIAAISVVCSGTVTLVPQPLLTVAPAALSGFSYLTGSGPSVVKSFKLSGRYLTGFPGNIAVKAADRYDVSLDSVNFSGTSISIAYSTDSLAPTKVYIRLKAGLPAGTYTGENIVITGAGAPAVSVTCSGAVSAPASQVLRWTPPLFTESDAVTITFDASQGDAGLKGYTGDVYAHTGVLTNLSVNAGDWKYVKSTWGTNTPETKLTRIGTDLYQFVINPNIRSYYSVAAGEQIQKVCFVFRSSNAQITGRDIGGADLFINVSSPGLNVIVLGPTTFPIIKNLDETQQISIASANSSNLALYADTTLLAQTTGNTINYNYTCASYGKIWFKAVASNSGIEKRDSFYVVVRPPATVQEVPSGIVDGINYITDSSVVLSLYAPLKQYAYVIGDFNKWQVDPSHYMKVSPDGKRYWAQIDHLIPGQEYGFQYLLDGTLNVGDPYCEKVLDLNFDKAISDTVYPNLKPYPTGLTTQMVSVLQTKQTPYLWTTTGYTKPPKDNLIIYELHIRDFVSTHMYKTLIDTLGYLKNLGINAIELMPVSEFDMNESWGYNPSFMLAPDKYYGTKNDLKNFIDVCHANGIAVIFDLVLNHQTGNSPLARMWWDVAANAPTANNPYFNVTAPHPYSVYNDLNHDSPATRYFVDRVVKHWLAEYKFDGYRFDLSKGFTQHSSSNDQGFNAFDQSRIDNLKRITQVLWGVDSTAYVILEHFAENSEEVALTNSKMMVWTKLSAEFARAGGGSSPMDLSWQSYKTRGFSSPAAVSYIESHDEERLLYNIMTTGGNSGSYNTRTLATAIDRAKLCAAFHIPIPGPKMIWQFGELGYDVSITVNGRDGAKPLHWEYFKDPIRQKLYKTVRYLNMLKTTYPVFRSTNFSTELTGITKSITLNDPAMNVKIIGNFGLTAQSITCNFQSTGTWYDYFTHSSISVTNTAMSYNLLPGEFHVFTSVQLPAPDMTTGISDGENNSVPVDYSLMQNYPNPFNPSTTITYQLPKAGYVSLKVYDVLGKEIVSLVNCQMQAGVHQVSFDGTGLPSGVYFYQIKAGDFSSVKKLILLK